MKRIFKAFMLVLIILVSSQGCCGNSINRIPELVDYGLKKFSDEYKKIEIPINYSAKIPHNISQIQRARRISIHNIIISNISPAIADLEKENLITGFYYIMHKNLDLIVFAKNWNEKRQKQTKKEQIEEILNRHIPPYNYNLGGHDNYEDTIKKWLDCNVLEFNSRLIMSFINSQTHLNNVEKEKMMEQCFREWIDDLYSQYGLDDFEKAKNHFSSSYAETEINNMCNKIDDIKNGRINNPTQANISVKKIDHNIREFNSKLISAFKDYKKYIIDKVPYDLDRIYNVKEKEESDLIENEIKRILEDCFKQQRWFQQWIHSDVDEKYTIMEMDSRQRTPRYRRPIQRYFHDWSRLNNVEKCEKMKGWFEQLMMQHCLNLWSHYLYNQYGIHNPEEGKYIFNNSSRWLERYFFNHPEKIGRIDSFCD